MTSMLLVLTGISVVTAVVATVVAWRVVLESQRRSDAGVALLADAIRAGEPPDSASVEVTHLLDDPQPTQGRQRLAVIATAGLLLVLVLALGRVAGSGSEEMVAERPDTRAMSVQADARPPSSIDLVALTHELGENGQLELRGEVRNESGSANMELVNVVALLFDQQGAYLSSARAPLQAHTNGSGRTASFLVAVPDGSRVGRYRVSFRAGDRIVPHVDQRQSR